MSGEGILLSIVVMLLLALARICRGGNSREIADKAYKSGLEMMDEYYKVTGKK
jgi:hypothetical protein